MRASVGSDGGCNSPGRNCMKSLKTAAVFHTSSSSLPSITGGLSKRATRTGFTFSGVRSAAYLAAAFAGSDAVGPAAAGEFVAGGVVAVEFPAGPLVVVFAGEPAGGVGVGV